MLAPGFWEQTRRVGPAVGFVHTLLDELEEVRDRRRVVRGLKGRAAMLMATRVSVAFFTRREEEPRFAHLRCFRCCFAII